jgi:hypothetical protein
MYKVGDRVKIIACLHSQHRDLLGSEFDVESIGYGELKYTVNGYFFAEKELEFVGRFTDPAPEPAVALSQQWLADRLSEAENNRDEGWIGDLDINDPWEYKDPDGDEEHEEEFASDWPHPDCD